MKGLQTSILVLGLVAWGTGVANANDLVNGNLDVVAISSQNEATPVGWIVDASQPGAGAQADACASQTWCNVAGPNGYGLFLKPFTGTYTDPLTVHFYQDNLAGPGAKYTLSGYAAGEPNYCGFYTTNSPLPATVFFIAFLNGGGTVIASNALDLVAAGMPVGGGGSLGLLTMPQVTAPAGTVTVRAGASMINAYFNADPSQSFFVDAFDLASEAPPGAPVITNQPSSTTVPAGGTATFTVGVSNTAGVSYAWQFYETNISNGGPYSGTTTKTLTVTGVSTNEVGHYRVRLTNGGGSVYSNPEAALAILGINFFPIIAIEGKIFDTYRVDYYTAIAPTTWIPLSTNRLMMSPQLVIDSSSPGSNTRFYKAVFLY